MAVFLCYDINMKKIAAFFDIDGTLYRDSLLTEVFKKFITHELVEPEKWYNEVKPAFTKYDRRQGDYDDYLIKMVDIYKDALVGMSSEHILHIAKTVISQKGDRVYRFTRDEIARHKKEGHLIFAVSGSPIELVKIMAEKYGFTDYRGTIYVTDKDNIYTGEVVPMWDHNSKAKALNELSELYDIDLSESYAYGDTTGDISMFEMVGNPYAMNPTKELIDQINERDDLTSKVNIVVERKNVIYHLKNDEIVTL